MDEHEHEHENELSMETRNSALDYAIQHVGNMMANNPAYIPTTDEVIRWATSFEQYLEGNDDA